MEQIAEFPDPVGGQQDFQPVQGSAASSSDLPGQAGQGVFRTFPQRSRAPRCRNCLRTRAHGRRRLMKRPWCLRRRRKRRRSAKRTLRWNTWSTTGACGGASGLLLASGTAGGWPLPMGPRLAIPYGGRRGSSAEVQGDVLGRQWIHVLRQLLCLCRIFLLST